MQRSNNCGSCQMTHFSSSSKAAEESGALLQSNSLHPVSSVTQSIHWRKRILNKTVLNKRRQNPARQAAVRSFKKYHFTNQDFLLRKYLRSVKKEMKPKQRDLLDPSANISNIAAFHSNNCSRSLVTSGCARQRNDIISKNSIDDFNKNRNNTINNSTSSTCIGVPAKTNSKPIKKKRRQNWEDVKSSIPQPIDIKKELKSCRIKNWPTNYTTYPTYETVQKDSSPFVFCDKKLQEVINESTKLVVEYGESLKELQDILNNSKDDDLCLTSSTNHNSIKGKDYYERGIYNPKKINETKNEKFVELCMSKLITKNKICEKTYSNKDYVNNNLQNNNGNLKFINNEYESNDESDYKKDVDDDNLSGKESEEDDDNVVDDSSGNDTKTMCFSKKDRNNSKRSIGNNKTKLLVNKRKPLLIRNKRKYRKASNCSQNRVVPEYTSDSSSICSDSTVSTETCCSDIQTIQPIEGDYTYVVSEFVKKSKTTKSVGRSEQSIKFVNNKNSVLNSENNNTDYEKSVSEEFLVACKDKLEDYKNCNIQSLMCNETEEYNVYDKDPTNKTYSSNNCKVNTECSEKIRYEQKRLEAQSRGYIMLDKINNSKIDYKNKIYNETAIHFKTNLSNKVKCPEFSGVLEKDRKLEDKPLFSTVCSVEDGLAFLDSENHTPSPNISPTNVSLIQNETITLYNNSTSCTLPVSKNEPKETQIKARNLLDHNYCMLPNTVASQTSPKTLRKTSLALEKNYPNSSKNKQLDKKLKTSLENAKLNISELILSTIVLNSFLTRQKETDVAELFLTKTNNVSELLN